MNHKQRNNPYFTTEQELLLKAVLLQGDSAIKAWEQWDKLTDINDIDHGSFRLLPLLYRFLKDHCIDTPILIKVKGVYRKSAVQNKIHSHVATQLIREFNSAGIKTMLLKGSALVHEGYYSDLGVRPMDDSDLMVPRQQLEKAIEVLENMGWTPKINRRDYIVRHAEEYIKGVHKIDLHWRLLPTGVNAELDMPLWENAVPITYHGEQAYVLNPAYQLMHVCLHGVNWNPVPPQRWIADAYHILTKPDIEINWHKLIEQVKIRRMSIAMFNALQIMQKYFEIAIPNDVMKKLNGEKSLMEKLWYSFAVNKPVIGIRGLPNHYFHYRLFFSSKLSFPGYIRYLKSTYRLDHCWEVPLTLLRKLLRNFITFLNRASVKTTSRLR